MDDKKTVETAAADVAQEKTEPKAPETTTLNPDMAYKESDIFGEKDWGARYCR